MLPCQCWSVFTQQWNILTSAGKHILIKMWPITRALRLITRFPPVKGHNVLIIQFIFIELILILSAGIPCFCYSQPATQWASNFNTLKRMSWFFMRLCQFSSWKKKWWASTLDNKASASGKFNQCKNALNLHSFSWPAGGSDSGCRNKSDCLEVYRKKTL